MKMYAGLALALLLGACGSDAQAPAAPAADAAAGAPSADLPVMGPERRILALGDSLFAGYGLSPGEGYPERLETALRARGVNARITNAGVSGDTTAGGRQRLAFVLGSMNPAPEVAVISLGGNDMLRGLPPQETRANLDAILTELKAKGVRPVLLGMLAAPNMGADYAGKFNPIYPALAKKHGAVLVPFFLQPLIDKPQLIQQDRIHPTAQGIELLVGDTIDEVTEAFPKT